jgi:hypothetical protein
VIQDALLVAVQAQPAVAVTVTVADPPPAAALADVGDAEYAHGAVNAKVLDWALGVLPPGPTDATSDTYMVPGTGQPTKTEVKSTRMMPSGSGFGLPSELLWNGCDAPERKRSRRYELTIGVPSDAVALWSGDGLNSALVGFMVCACDGVGVDAKTSNVMTPTNADRTERINGISASTRMGSGPRCTFRAHSARDRPIS